MPATALSAPLFMLSFRYRDELAALAERAGWRAIAARRAEAVQQRFIASGASIAVVDARGAYDEGLAAAAALSDTVETNGAALLVLLSKPDVGAVDAVFTAGATHYLASPFGDIEFTHSLRFAARYVTRLNGGRRPAIDRGALVEAEAESWHWRRGAGQIALSPALARRIGREGEELVAVADAVARIAPGGQRAAREALLRLLRAGAATAFAHDDITEAGERRRVAHHIRLDTDGVTVHGRLEDIEPIGAPGRVASRDPLTGLDDARAARRWIEARLAAGGDPHPRVIALIVAVSRFDMINAAFGRVAGDALLQGVARRIERLVNGLGPQRRITARLAGAEFLVGLGGATRIEEAMLLGRQIAEAIARPFVAGDHVVPLAAHVGVALAEPGELDAQPLLRRASAALAEARLGEGSAVRLVSAEEEEANRLASRLEVDLRVALDQDEIEILFQPQVAITGGAIVGVEALARWRHPRYGELGAAPLFAAAERSDYLAQLSAHVQKKAIAMVAAWPRALAGLRVAVNVTAADIAAPGFAEGFLAMVDAAGVDRGRITVEVTESGLIEDLGGAAGLLAALRRAGFRVAIDDFGTGYSSLAYLKALPLDYLKIDKRLAEDIAGSARDRVVVRGVIEMARSLGLTVIAEGVETETQLALLAAEGCNIYQGFLCAPPLDTKALVRLVKRWGRGGA